jgi:hypothetical protein
MYKPVYTVVANVSEQRRAQVLQIRARDRREAITKARQQGAYLIKSICQIKAG